MSRLNPTDFEVRSLADKCPKCHAHPGEWCRSDSTYHNGMWCRALHNGRLEIAHHNAWVALERSIARHPAGKGLGGDAA